MVHYRVREGAAEPIFGGSYRTVRGYLEGAVVALDCVMVLPKPMTEGIGLVERK